jgi:far upstream element-binding protein
MTVPGNKVGLIIGKEGETIKDMQIKSGARIQLIPQHPLEGVTLTERIVRVTGNKKQIEVAKDLIKQAMNQTFSKHTNQSGRYGPQGGPSGSWCMFSVVIFNLSCTESSLQDVNYINY